jgi:hypothetical protein
LDWVERFLRQRRSRSAKPLNHGLPRSARLQLGNPRQIGDCLLRQTPPLSARPLSKGVINIFRNVSDLKGGHAYTKRMRLV